VNREAWRKKRSAGSGGVFRNETNESMRDEDVIEVINGLHQNYYANINKTFNKIWYEASQNYPNYFFKRTQQCVRLKKKHF